jgi:hypothetical protein
MMIRREVYIEADEPNTAKWVAGAGYLDGGLTREEILKTSQASDDYRNWRRRISPDNGRTWSEPEFMPEVNVQLPEGGIATHPGNPYWNPAAGLLLRPVMKRFWPGNELYTFDWETGEHPFQDHSFIKTGRDKLILLRFEDGPDYDPDDPFNRDFVMKNQSYKGQSICYDSDGNGYHPIVCRKSAPGNMKDGGLVLMRNKAGTDEWVPSNTVYLPPEVSSRGVLEPDAAVLTDGRILVVVRGSDTPRTPGRKWMTWSDDGGRTLRPLEEFRYNDGSRFYSPSSIHRFIRSGRNGKLYWITNIVPEPPSGNRPRYPLQIAEIDEDSVSVKRNSLTAVDDREPGEPDIIQFSNFHVIENRETLNFEIYMTRLGEDPADPRKSGVYRYVFNT